MLVSVLINNYNYARFLDECLLSVIKQTYKNIEIILYDDGSTDHSLEVARKYSNIKIIAADNYQKKPAFNQANAINQAFAISKGEIICLLDSDDYFELNKIDVIVDAFKSDNNLVLVQNAAFVTMNGVIIGTHDYSVTNIDYKKLYYKKRWTGFYNPTSTLSFRRQYLERILPMREDEYWRVWPDVRLSRIAPYYGVVKALPDKLTYYRKHGNNDSSFMNKSGYSTFLNQFSHHVYLNKQLKQIGERQVLFFFSFTFIKFLIKIIYPKKFK